MPARMSDEPALVRHGGPLRGVEDSEIIVRLRQRELYVADRRHGCKRGCFLIAEWENRFITIQ